MAEKKTVEKTEAKKAKVRPVFEAKIVYCTECKPPTIQSTGPGVATSHVTVEKRDRKGKITYKGGVVHTKLKGIPLDPKDARQLNEPPQKYLDRLAKTYKSQLV